MRNWTISLTEKNILLVEQTPKKAIYRRRNLNNDITAIKLIKILLVKIIFVINLEVQILTPNSKSDDLYIYL